MDKPRLLWAKASFRLTFIVSAETKKTSSYNVLCFQLQTRGTFCLLLLCLYKQNPLLLHHQQTQKRNQYHSNKTETKMSSASKTWMVAASIGAVEALKDQLGVCRWNYVIRSANQYLRNNLRSVSQAKNLSSSSFDYTNKTKQAEESLRTVMYLSCWGPS